MTGFTDYTTQYVYWVDGKLGTVSHNSAMKSADQWLLQQVPFYDAHCNHPLQSAMTT